MGDDEGYLLDMLTRAKPTRGGGARARNHPARVHGMPERWSPRALVHTVAHGRPNDVWGFVLPGVVATQVVVRLKGLWLNGKQPLKFTAVNLAVKQYSTEV